MKPDDKTEQSLEEIAHYWCYLHFGVTSFYIA